MKILFPLNSFYPTTMGGPGTILYWQNVYLRKHGCKPTIITTTNGIKKKIITNKLLDLPCGKVYYGDKGLLNPLALKNLYKAVINADIIHLTSLFSPSSILAFLFTMFFNRNVPIVWSVRGELNCNALKINSLKKNVLLFVYKIFTKKVTFASTSPKETIEIKTNFRKNSIIELPNLMPSTARLIHNNNSKRFLFLGRVHPIKNIESLIKAFYQSEAFTADDVFLDIAGEFDERDTAYFQMLQDFVSKNNMQHKVKFLGHIAGSKKETLLANAFFLVLPSHSENFGNVVIEALNQGTPVIASIQTPWKELEKKNAGFWIENSVESLSNIIDHTTQLSSKCYQNYRANAYILVDENYNIDNQIQKWIFEYKKLLN